MKVFWVQPDEKAEIEPHFNCNAKDKCPDRLKISFHEGEWTVDSEAMITKEKLE